MDFDIHKRKNDTKESYSDHALDTAYEFSKKINEELHEVIKAVVLFGSVARKSGDANDIDILLIIDDVSVHFTEELVQTYRVIVKKTVQDVSEDLHITSMKFTSFWEYVRSGDPIAINILRDGYPLLDAGFFEPTQHLLRQGRIQPSKEAMWTYMNRAEQSMASSSQRRLEAVHDLYWAVIDASHAALIDIGEAPPSPRHVAGLLENTLVKRGTLKKKDAKLVRRLYALSKDISKGKRTHVEPELLKTLDAKAKAFVNVIKEKVYEDS
jgi:predicted nucleotidyltransferase/uncharacterized protein (UPF0332 family)